MKFSFNRMEVLVIKTVKRLLKWCVFMAVVCLILIVIKSFVGAEFVRNFFAGLGACYLSSLVVKATEKGE